MTRFSFRFSALLIAAALAPTTHANEVTRVGGESLKPHLHAKHAAVGWLSAESGSAMTVARLDLSMPIQTRIDALKSERQDGGIGPIAIGFERDLAKDVAFHSPLHWEMVAGGSVARLDVVSPGAAALRVAVSATGLPDGATLRYRGTDPGGEVLGATLQQLRDHTDDLNRFWTSTTSGDSQRLEWFVPDQSATPLTPPRIVGVSHLVVDPLNTRPISKGLGDANSCHDNIACHVESLGPGFVAAKNSVAHYVFQGCVGFQTCMCSGSLINDGDPTTQRKLFYTAHHCINTAAKANTIDTFWNYEAAVCGAVSAGANIRVTGGADLITAAWAADAVLLELRGNLPATAHFSGWDATAMPSQSPVVGIHHPRGDSKKVAIGSLSSVIPYAHFGESVFANALSVRFTRGGMEGASSGSGIFTTDGQDYYLRGSLIGGDSGCGASSVYGSFAQAYPALQDVLGRLPPGPSENYTGAWHNDAEPGRGLTLYRFPNEHLFSLWFVHDDEGLPHWYELDGTWTAPDVRSGRVIRWQGDAWGPTYDPDLRSHETVGTFSLTFRSASEANFSYNVDGVARTMPLVKITP